MAKQKYYAVIEGRVPGIYDRWQGEGGAQAHVTKFPGAVYKGFSSFIEAKMWFSQHKNGNDAVSDVANPDLSHKVSVDLPKESASSKVITIYTDGGSLGNPGPGGYGAVLIYGRHRKEISGGFRKTTNNRMELTACIEGLKQLKYPCTVSLYSDSRYVVDGISKGWAKRWRANNWMRNKTEPAENADLWAQLLMLCDKHTVTFSWVRGHAGNPENERCDQLAGQMSSQAKLPPDIAYETGRTHFPSLAV